MRTFHRLCLLIIVFTGDLPGAFWFWQTITGYLVFIRLVSENGRGNICYLSERSLDGGHGVGPQAHEGQ